MRAPERDTGSNGARPPAPAPHLPTRKSKQQHRLLTPRSFSPIRTLAGIYDARIRPNVSPDQSEQRDLYAERLLAPRPTFLVPNCEAHAHQHARASLTLTDPSSLSAQNNRRAAARSALPLPRTSAIGLGRIAPGYVRFWKPVNKSSRHVRRLLA